MWINVFLHGGRKYGDARAQSDLVGPYWLTCVLNLPRGVLRTGQDNGIGGAMKTYLLYLSFYGYCDVIYHVVFVVVVATYICLMYVVDHHTRSAPSYFIYSTVIHCTGVKLSQSRSTSRTQRMLFMRRRVFKQSASRSERASSDSKKHWMYILLSATSSLN